MRYYLLLFCLLLALPGWAQPRTKRYVREHLHPVGTIEPTTADYADLAAFGEAIGAARVVMLGEQDHGDGATMQAKTRLIRYLHEQKGFNVLAFEGDLFALGAGWAQVANQPAAQPGFLHATIHPYWSRCQQCDYLLSTYLPQTAGSPAPLRLAGFDNQLYSDWSRQHLPGYLHAWLSREQVPFGRGRTYRQFFRPFLDTLLVSSNFMTGKLDLDHPELPTHGMQDKQGKLRRFEACLDTIATQLPPLAGSEPLERLLLRNLHALARESAVYTDDHVATANIRDAQMAANLDWLVNEQHAGEKVIVWAASAHLAKGRGSDYLVPAGLPAAQQTALHRQLAAVHSMGQVFTDTPLNRTKTYVLGFLSGGGTSQRTVGTAPVALPAPTRHSLESWLPAGQPYAFLDLQPLRAEADTPGTVSEYFAMQGLHHYPQYADWPRFFDGVFYIATMTPCQPSGYQPGQ